MKMRRLHFAHEIRVLLNPCTKDANLQRVVAWLPDYASRRANSFAAAPGGTMPLALDNQWNSVVFNRRYSFQPKLTVVFPIAHK
jgi:hypothetical protein